MTSGPFRHPFINYRLNGDVWGYLVEKIPQIRFPMQWSILVISTFITKKHIVYMILQTELLCIIVGWSRYGLGQIHDPKPRPRT